MSDEVELKFKINDYKEIVSKLLEISSFESSTYEVTIMYDENKKLFNNDARLRLRRKVDLKTKKEEVEISYKKPKTRDGIKIEEEYETLVGNFIEMEKILTNIGFMRVSSYERIRDTFKVKNIKITIDSFPFGDYIELEGNIEEIKIIAKEMGFNMKNNITKSYDDIYNEICLSKGIQTPSNIVFENKEDLEKEKQKRTFLYENF